MNRRMVWRNLTRSKVVSLTTVLFITAASALLSLAAILAFNLSGAVDQLMLDAKTPHFMQMHSGEMDLSSLEAFAEDNHNVEDFQVIHFLNLDNSQIILGENFLGDRLQDNGVCVQSSQFDFLLDLNNKPVYPRDGEISALTL